MCNDNESAPVALFGTFDDHTIFSIQSRYADTRTYSSERSVPQPNEEGLILTPTSSVELDA